MIFFRFFILLAFGSLNILNIQMTFAQESEEDLEKKVKSAYIFKFGNYVTWPEKTFADSLSPIIIGVLGDEPIAKELEKIAASHKTANRPVIVKRLKANDNFSVVHILYVSNPLMKQLATYQQTLQSPPTLYITDSLEGIKEGGVINFVKDDNRIRFDISIPAAELNKIHLDASLFTVAKNVLK